jgi:hypothetical protein
MDKNVKKNTAKKVVKGTVTGVRVVFHIFRIVLFVIAVITIIAVVRALGSFVAMWG